MVHAGDGHDAVQARVAEELSVVDVRQGEDLDIGLRGGVLETVRLEFTHGGSGVIDFGPRGGDLQVYNRRSVAVDLEDGVMALDSKSPTYQLHGAQDVTASARRVTIEGDRRENLLYVVSNTCRAAMEGGRGDDTLVMIGNWDLPDFACGRNEITRFIGQRGNDRLLARYKDDVLIGGPGRDYARGARGLDTCRAEREKGCER